VQKHRAVIIGAGRIGAGYQWDQDLAYTHAGAYQALKDRVELVGFIESDNDRATAAKAKWLLPVYEDVPTGLAALRPDIVSICVQPHQQNTVYMQLDLESLKGIWQEKPFVVPVREWGIPIQVNYMRRGDEYHRKILYDKSDSHKNWTLYVYGKDDIHTKCHFEDLAKWWDVELDYRVFNGPCAYILQNHCSGDTWFFDNGGVDGGSCFKAMLENLLDVVDGAKNKYGDEISLWSPAT